MKFSTKAEYGMRAIVHLAKKSGLVSLAEIAKQEHLSLAYLERIFALLKKANIVTSFKGTNGGYALARKAEQIKVSEIIQALEGSLYELKCGAFHVGGCSVNRVCNRLYDQINKTLNSISLKSLIK